MSSEWTLQKISAIGSVDRGKSKHRPPAWIPAFSGMTALGVVLYWLIRAKLGGMGHEF